MYHEFMNRGWFEELDLEGINLVEVSSPGVDRLFQMPFGRYDEFIDYCKGNWQSICSTQIIVTRLKYQATAIWISFASSAHGLTKMNQFLIQSERGV